MQLQPRPFALNCAVCSAGTQRGKLAPALQRHFEETTSIVVCLYVQDLLLKSRLLLDNKKSFAGLVRQ